MNTFSFCYFRNLFIKIKLYRSFSVIQIWQKEKVSESKPIITSERKKRKQLVLITENQLILSETLHVCHRTTLVSAQMTPNS